MRVTLTVSQDTEDRKVRYSVSNSEDDTMAAGALGYDPADPASLDLAWARANEIVRTYWLRHLPET